MRTRIIGACVFVLILGTLTSWRSARVARTAPRPFQPVAVPVPPLQSFSQRAAAPPPPPAVPAASGSELADAEKFCGTWAYTDQGSTLYFKISRVGPRFRFDLFQKWEGKLSKLGTSVTGADAIYLGVANGQLTGEFVSMNFYATHGEEFTYRVTLAAETNDKLSYSVYSSIHGDTKKLEATKYVE